MTIPDMLIDLVEEVKILAKCFICGAELTSENKSQEHILLNALGGTLTSKNLICKHCNSTLGNEMDDVLAKQLQPFALLLDVSRDRGSTPVMTAVHTQTKEEILILPGGKPAMKKPRVLFFEENGEKKYQIIARDKREAKAIFKGIKEKYPNVSIVHFEEKREPFNEKVSFQTSFGGDAFLSVCKTAICYYLYCGGVLSEIQPFIARWLDKDIWDDCNFCYIDKPVVSKAENTVCHTLVMIGDSENRLLYAYIELFDFYRFLVLLSDHYTGPEEKNIYCYDLIRKAVVEANIKMQLSRQNINEILAKDTAEFENLLLQALRSTMRKIETKRLTEQVWNELFEDIGSCYPEGIPISLFSKLFAEKMVQKLMVVSQDGNDLPMKS